MAKKPTRVKSETYAVSLQTRDDVERAINHIGELQRKLAQLAIDQNAELAEITDKYAPILNEVKEELKPWQQAVQAWCESRRDELTQNGRTKTGYFNAGEVQWRQKPPSIGIRGIESVLENLRTLGLNQFIRVKEEVNKEAMLNEPELAATIAGVTVKTGIEEFVIKPNEQEVNK